MKIFEIIIFGCIGGFLLWIIDWKINRLALGAPLKLLLPTLLGGGLFQGGITIHKPPTKPKVVFSSNGHFGIGWVSAFLSLLCLLFYQELSLPPSD